MRTCAGRAGMGGSTGALTFLPVSLAGAGGADGRAVAACRSWSSWLPAEDIVEICDGGEGRWAVARAEAAGQGLHRQAPSWVGCCAVLRSW